MDAAVIDPRQQRGLVLANGSRIKRLTDSTWLVPSATSSGGYVVDTSTRTCSCPDFELRSVRCKHQWAVSYARHEVTAPDGSKVITETMRVTYRQNWPAYNAAQCEEKERVQMLLRGLCAGIKQPPYRGRGRPRVPLADVIYAATMKVFVGLSGRRASSDIRDAKAKGLIDHAAHYNSISDYLLRPELTPLLKVLIQESASPLAAVESKFAIDATGFTTVGYTRWFDEKYGKERSEHVWVKLHAVTGVHTNVVTAAEVTEGSLNDSPYLPPLVAETAERFKVQELLADKGYVGVKNLEAIEKIGAQAYIPFKENNQGNGPDVWRRMWHLFSFHRPEFLAHYHARSNVESTFSSIKRKFGATVRSKDHVSQVNEVLLKVLAANLSCLVHATHELGIETTFWKAPRAKPPTIQVMP